MMGWGNMMWGYGSGYGNGFWGNGNYWWMGLVMMAFQLLFWGLLIWFGVALFKKVRGNSLSTYGRNDALDILRERYARGEIDTEEFRRRKEDLIK
jgi:putative membrane protein